MSARIRLLGWLAALAASWPPNVAAAHDGPPFDVAENVQAGPFMLSIWADPDVGNGELFVVVHPGPETTETLLVKAIVTLADSDRPPLRADGKLSPVGGIVGDRFHVAVPFDVDGLWHVRLEVSSGDRIGEFDFDLEVLPEGPQAWEAWTYTMPFVLLALALGFGYWRTRKISSRETAST